MNKIIILGNPVPLKRPRFNKRTGKVFNSQSKTMKTNAFFIAAQYSGQKLTGPLQISATFFMPIPKSLSKKKQLLLDGQYHDKHVDIDNLNKKLYDEIVYAGNIIEDDSQFAKSNSMKIYSFNPRTEFTISKLRGNNG